jgi:hypothetical protein
MVRQFLRDVDPEETGRIGRAARRHAFKQIMDYINSHSDDGVQPTISHISGVGVYSVKAFLAGITWSVNDLCRLNRE